MGDRGNIIITGSSMFPHPLFCYTHWSGSELPGIIRQALVKGRDRWDDPPYLARVLFQQLLGKDTGITGYGLSTAQGDGGTDITVNMEDQTVIHRGKAVSFADYIA